MTLIKWPNAIRTLIGSVELLPLVCLVLLDLALSCYYKIKQLAKTELLSYLENARKILFETRPTAVNLDWGLEKIMNVAKSGDSVENIRGFSDFYG